MKRISLTEFLGTRTVQNFSSIRETEVSSLVDSIHSSSQNDKNTINISKSMREAAQVAGGFDLLDFYPSLEFLNGASGLKLKTAQNRASMYGCGSGSSGGRNPVVGWLHKEHKRWMRMGDWVEMGWRWRGAESVGSCDR
ncbi:unnamed protein product [Linum trigynum]|uniref:Uncharacterized protein n=1 Tax=Linum trigynum TaxID=586398 RepID=A0AAV2EP49_9ROSI